MNVNKCEFLSWLLNLKKAKAHDKTIRACVINLKISYRQLSMPKDLTSSKKMSIDVFHTISALTSIILVHVNYASYKHKMAS